MDSAHADAPGTEGPASAVAAGDAQAEEAEASVTADDLALDAAFGPVSRWWVGEVPGLGVMRLPLP